METRELMEKVDEVVRKNGNTGNPGVAFMHASHPLRILTSADKLEVLSGHYYPHTIAIPPGPAAPTAMDFAGEGGKTFVPFRGVGLNRAGNDVHPFFYGGTFRHNVDESDRFLPLEPGYHRVIDHVNRHTFIIPEAAREAWRQGIIDSVFEQVYEVLSEPRAVPNNVTRLDWWQELRGIWQKVMEVRREVNELTDDQLRGTASCA